MNGEYSINGDEFDHDRVEVCPRLNTAEEWALSSSGDIHPFHVHVNPFEVIEKDAQGKIVNRYWKDTLILLESNSPDQPIFIRTRFETFAGKTVLHCHNLVHEDQGMMMAMRIVGKAPSSRCRSPKSVGLGSLPARAPAWTLPDADGNIHRATEFAGRNIVLIFFRGMGCAHCRRQLDALARRQFDLQAAGLTVIGVCPDAPDVVSRTLRKSTPEWRPPFLLLSDVSLDSFRNFGCHDGSALHGTFLINCRGLVTWQHVADEPYMDVEKLVKEGRKLSEVHQPSGG